MVIEGRCSMYPLGFMPGPLDFTLLYVGAGIACAIPLLALIAAVISAKRGRRRAVLKACALPGIAGPAFMALLGFPIAIGLDKLVNISADDAVGWTYGVLSGLFTVSVIVAALMTRRKKPHEEASERGS